MQATETVPSLQHIPPATPRQEVALRATYQIHALATALRRELRTPDVADTEFADLAIGLLLRIEELNSVTMSVLAGESNRKTSEIQTVVFGECGGVQAA